MTVMPETAHTECTQRRYFAHLRSSVPGARQWARHIVSDDWGRSTDIADTVALCITELTANAVRHAPLAVGGRVRDILVELHALPDAVRVEVHDAGGGTPVLQHGDSDDEGGRGLLLVDAITRAWGTHPREPFGKVVWCEVAGE